MKLNIFLEALFWFFAMTGFFQLMLDIYNFFHFRTKHEQSFSECIVLTVKDCQDNVEGFVRSVIWKHLQGKTTANIDEIIIVDLDSEDDTPKILKKLCRDYNFIHVTDKDGYIDLIRKMA